MTGKKTIAQEGFTLLEVMIGLAILSFIMIGVITITDDSQETATRVMKEDRAILQAETAMSRLEWDVSQAWSPLYFSHAMEPSGLTENEGQVYNQMVDRYAMNSRFAFPSYEHLPVPTNRLREKHTFTFFTASNRRKFKNVKQSHFAWVRYTLMDPEEVPGRRQDDDLEEEDPKGKVLVRKFLADNVFDSEEIDWESVKSQVLLRNVENLVFEFWNPQVKKWTDNLATIKEGSHRLHGVKITMEWLDEDQVPRSYIRVFRPLFPSGFEAENMYKLKKAAQAGANGNDPNNGSNGAGDFDGQEQ